MLIHSRAKPLFRWTLGKVYGLGYDICIESVKRARRIWGDEVDYVVVCNNVAQHIMEHLRMNLGDILRFAEPNSLPFYPNSLAWKCYPPRLRLNSHELFIDNDLVLLKRSEYIEKFLSGDYVLYNEDIGRGFADFERLVRSVRPEYKIGLNSGLFGYPPGYDVHTEILKVCTGFRQHLSEQGLVAYLLLRYPNRVGIPMPFVFNDNCGNNYLRTYGGLYRNVHLDNMFMSTLHGYHFIGANRGRHNAWAEFINPRKLTKLL